MNETPSLADFDKALKALGVAFYDWIQSQMLAKPWTGATLDVRYAGDGSFLDKIRVATPDQQRRDPPGPPGLPDPAGRALAGRARRVDPGPAAGEATDRRVGSETA